MYDTGYEATGDRRQTQLRQVVTKQDTWPSRARRECYRKGIRTCYLPTLIRTSRESTMPKQYESQMLIPPIKRSCVSVGTRKGYSITNCDPFGRVYTMSKPYCHRKISYMLIRR